MTGVNPLFPLFSFFCDLLSTFLVSFFKGGCCPDRCQNRCLMRSFVINLIFLSLFSVEEYEKQLHFLRTPCTLAGLLRKVSIEPHLCIADNDTYVSGIENGDVCKHAVCGARGFDYTLPDTCLPTQLEIRVKPILRAPNGSKLPPPRRGLATFQTEYMASSQ